MELFLKMCASAKDTLKHFETVATLIVFDGSCYTDVGSCCWLSWEGVKVNQFCAKIKATTVKKCVLSWF